jgi:hypothetical protein
MRTKTHALITVALLLAAVAASPARATVPRLTAALFLARVIVESAAAKLYTQLGITNSAVNRAKDRAEAIEQQRKTDNELIWKVLLWERIQ